METMGKTKLSRVGFLSILLFFSFNGAFGQDIVQLAERIEVDSVASLKVDLKSPFSFCITEDKQDKLFLIPDQTGTIKVFSKEENFLKFVKELGPSVGEESFVNPRYCAYRRGGGGKFAMLAIIDYGAKKVFILERTGKVDFTPFKSFPCRRLGYDIEFSECGEQLVISGYLVDRENKPFDLYSINIGSGDINYLLPSPQKYNLRTFEEYVLEYRQKLALPALGVKAFIGIQENSLFFAWEAGSRVIKIDLPPSKETTDYFEHQTTHYSNPDESKLVNSYLRGDFKTADEERKKRAYVVNIFAAPTYVFLVYEIPGNNESNVSTFRLQKYTQEGNYEGELLIPDNPSRQMYFDKENYELYAFSNDSNSDDGRFTILKYKVNW